jgi:hypothetical protein
MENENLNIPLFKIGEFVKVKRNSFETCKQSDMFVGSVNKILYRECKDGEYRYNIAGYWWKECDIESVKNKAQFVKIKESRIKLSSIVFYEVVFSPTRKVFNLKVTTSKTVYNNYGTSEEVKKWVEELDKNLL